MVVDFLELYETGSHRYVPGDPRLLKEQPIHPATVAANEAGLHSLPLLPDIYVIARDRRASTPG